MNDLPDREFRMTGFVTVQFQEKLVSFWNPDLHELSGLSPVILRQSPGVILSGICLFFCSLEKIDLALLKRAWTWKVHFGTMKIRQSGSILWAVGLTKFEFHRNPPSLPATGFILNIFSRNFPGIPMTKKDH